MRLHPHLKLMLFTIALLALGFGVSAGTKAARPQVRTAEGLLVDLKCYTMDPAEIGNDHTTSAGKPWVGCAAVCARMGVPVGLLVGGKAGGEVLVLVAAAPPLADHMGGWARVKGSVVLDGKGLVTRTIEVRDQKGVYSKVESPTMN
jgi:hypothetical protein